jgi:hypothetical protein
LEITYAYAFPGAAHRAMPGMGGQRDARGESLAYIFYLTRVIQAAPRQPV